MRALAGNDMKVERRVAAVLGVVALVAVPAAALRAFCIGRACDEEGSAARTVPFCSLPTNLREAVAAGYREGRSPEVLGVTRSGVEVVSGTGEPSGSRWPSLDDASHPNRVPVAFWGRGVATGAEIGTIGLDDLAPTLADIAAIDIPHPEVRSGRAVDAVADGRRPRLIATIVVRDVEDPGSDPLLNALGGGGVVTGARLGTLPADPAALLTTIGTGGLPSQHGITGTLVRNEGAHVAEAWAVRRTGNRSIPFRHPPLSVIATLADDLDEIMDERPEIALVADVPQARGLIGGRWYIGTDRDTVRIVPTARVVPALQDLAGDGFARDPIPDLIAVTLRARRDEGAAGALHVLRVLQGAVGDSFAAAMVLLPHRDPARTRIPAARIADAVDSALGRRVVEADTPGGLFLDQERLARARITKDAVVDVLRAYEHRGQRVFADVFPGSAVAFARFC